ncbi:MAG: DUF4918 family protein [Spirochaetales bacterium]|nr:DUF4918 family protein [Spirochaetales bacterium]
MKTTLAQKILHWLENLQFKGKLPASIEILSPYAPGSEALQIARTFYHKYYTAPGPRRLILGINPGRLGGGTTGIPFSDTRRLREFCNISTSFQLYEPSSVFFYEVVSASGGAEKFYHSFFVGATCPLGLIKKEFGTIKNCNYYDSPEILQSLLPFIVENLKAQLAMVDSREVFCLGRDKNYTFLKKLNRTHGFFERITPLDHPRFIMQYRSRNRADYVQKYLAALGQEGVL